MALIKALLLGGILTFVISTIIGSNGSSGGFLNIHHPAVAGHAFHWSWPLFIAAAGIAWGILLLMD
jgi:hypothetical protein